MTNHDDKHSDHDLKAYLDGRDGVSAAYRKTAHEEPPAALDRLILAAARKGTQPSAESWYAARKPYALAASVMIAITGLSLYLSVLDEVVLEPAAPAAQSQAVRAIEFQRAERAEPVQPDETEAASELNVALSQREARQLAPPVPTISAGAAANAPAPAPAITTDAFARSVEAPAIVIDGPLLEQIEAEDAAAREQVVATSELQEITVTGSRIMARDEGDFSYRDSREDWLAEMRNLARELERSSRVTIAQRSTALLENQLREEMDLFLVEYPGTDLEAELDE